MKKHRHRFCFPAVALAAVLGAFSPAAAHAAALQTPAEAFLLKPDYSRTIFGTDQLEIVDEAHRKQYPFSTVVAIHTEYPNGNSGQSTGFLIGRNTLLTCGHCVYSPAKGGLCQSIEFYPGSDNSSKPFGTFHASPSDVSIHPVWLASAENAGTDEHWYRSTDQGYDLAVIRLSEPVGDQTGWLGLKWQESDLNGVPATLTGYPAGYRMKTANGIIVSTTDNELVYRIDSEPGSSGSPIYVENRDGTCSVVGVNKSHNTEDNQAVRITEEKYQWILSVAGSGDSSVISEYGQGGTSQAAGDYSMQTFNEAAYAGAWKRVVTGYRAYIPTNWTQTGTGADHVYAVSNEADELFMAFSTRDASAASVTADLLEILENSEGLDPLILLANTGAIIEFFSDLNNLGDLTGSSTGKIVINGMSARTNSLFLNDIFLQAIRLDSADNSDVILIVGNLSDGKISAVGTNILDSFQAE